MQCPYLENTDDPGQRWAGESERHRAAAPTPAAVSPAHLKRPRSAGGRGTGAGGGGSAGEGYFPLPEAGPYSPPKDAPAGRRQKRNVLWAGTEPSRCQASAVGPLPRGCSQTRDAETRGDALCKHQCGQVRGGAARARAGRLPAAPAVPAARAAQPAQKPQSARLAGGWRATRVAGVTVAGRAGGLRAAGKCPETNGAYLLGGNSILEPFPAWA